MPDGSPVPHLVCHRIGEHLHRPGTRDAEADEMYLPVQVRESQLAV
jgi:hypothetical protein